METDTISRLAQFLPMMLIGIFFSIGSYHLAKRLNKNQVLWVILTIIPIINVFFYFYVTFCVVYAVLDKLKAIQDALDSRRV